MPYYYNRNEIKKIEGIQDNLHWYGPTRLELVAVRKLAPGTSVRHKTKTGKHLLPGQTQSK